MELSKTQVQAYERDGYLVLPEMHSRAEVAAMKAELRRVQGIDTDHLVRERAGGIAKTIYRVHEADGPTASVPFHRAARSPRLLAPARQLLGDDALYVYHTKCNLKTAIDGSVWAWHQDYGTWRRDGVPEARLTTALLMLDEPTEIGGCLYFIAGSHRAGAIEPEYDESTGYKFWVVPKSALLEIMRTSPEPVPITASRGLSCFSTRTCCTLRATTCRATTAGRSMWSITRSRTGRTTCRRHGRTMCAPQISRRLRSVAIR